VVFSNIRSANFTIYSVIIIALVFSTLIQTCMSVHGFDSAEDNKLVTFCFRVCFLLLLIWLYFVYFYLFNYVIIRKIHIVSSINFVIVFNHYYDIIYYFILYEIVILLLMYWTANFNTLKMMNNFFFLSWSRVWFVVSTFN